MREWRRGKNTLRRIARVVNGIDGRQRGLTSLVPRGWTTKRFLPGRRKGGAALATSRATLASAVPRSPSRGVVRRQEAAS
jgi:hypothetical protein